MTENMTQIYDFAPAYKYKIPIVDMKEDVIIEICSEKPH